MSVYLIRNGYGDVLYNFEVLWLFLCLVLAYLRNKAGYGLDYFWVLLFGSIYWALAEILLFWRGTRDGSDDGLVDEFVFLGHSISGGFLPGVIRGVGEGACITIIGLLPADHFAFGFSEDRSIMFCFVSGLLVLSFALVTLVNCQQQKAVGSEVDSRRDVTKTTSLIVSWVFCLLGVVLFLRCQDRFMRKRTVLLFISLCIVGLSVNYEVSGIGNCSFVLLLFLLSPPLLLVYFRCSSAICDGSRLTAMAMMATTMTVNY